MIFIFCRLFLLQWPLSSPTSPKIYAIAEKKYLVSLQVFFDHWIIKSLLTNSETSGIEPLFLKNYIRSILNWEKQGTFMRFS